LNRNYTTWLIVLQVALIPTLLTKLEALPATAVPLAFEVRQYDVVGDTLLGPQAIGAVFTNAIGPSVSLNQVFKALAGLHRVYQQRGFQGVDVTIPQQEITNGIVLVKVTESAFARLYARTHATASGAANTPAPLTLEVRQYEISGNTVLPSETIATLFTNALGKTVTLDQIRKAVGDLQLAYRERGFVTVSVGLPPQQVTNGTVKVSVTEGTLAVIKVTDNRYFSSNNIMRALPSLRTNALLNGQVFQRELDLANANRDRQIYPTISPGPDPGTTALMLRVKDRLPLHGRFDLDNYSTPGTPDLRLNLAGQYNNLWQLEHQVGLSYGFSPQALKSGVGVTDYFFNRPLIAYYGAYYRLPIGAVQSVGEEVNLSSSFGYNEATHLFRLPPAGGRPDFTIYANASSGDTGVKLGPLNTVTDTQLLSIQTQDSGQNITLNDVLGGRFSLPVSLSDNARLSFSAGIDFKSYTLNSFNTNNFYITTVITNQQGSQTIQTVEQLGQPAHHSEVSYLPLSLAVDFSESDQLGNTSVNVSGSFNFVGDSADFAQAAYSTNARALFGKLNLALSRELKLYREWSLLAQAGAQASPGALINNEQFALGGINSVRGYFEGESYGDSGWFTGLEARTPFLKTSVASFDGFVPTWVRASIFMEYGQRFLFDAASGLKPTESLWGAGFGFSANINNYFDLRVAVGWPLISTPFSRAGEPRAEFTIGGQF
jgi:hemolysin activation/secretion protein